MIKLRELLEIQGQLSKDNKEFTDFAEARLKGATKISDDAEKKGGPALLTHEHFVVKLPYYERAAKGECTVDELRHEFKNELAKLCVLSGGDVKMEQMEFQRLVGLIEVLGELIIKHNE